MSDLIDRQAAIDALRKMQTYKLFSGDDMLLIDQAGAQTELMLLPPAQPEQLEQCPIYGGMCAYPSDQCYDCPRHAGAKMGVTECIERPKSLGFDRRPEWPFGGDET